MASLLAAISVIGGMGSDNPGRSFKKLVKGQSRSVSAAMTLMTNPHPEQWIQRDIPDGAMSGWTQSIQGVASDGVFWYFSSNGSDNPTGQSLQGIHRFEVATGNQAPSFLYNGFFQGVRFGLKTLGDIDPNLGQPSDRCHFGAITMRDSQILAAIENPLGVLTIDARDGTLLAFHPLKGATAGAKPPQDQNPWCSLNPLNQLVYSSTFNDPQAASGTVHAYDPRRFYVHVPEADIHLDEFPPRIQGGCFSPDGHLFLSSDQQGGKQRFIHVYSSLSGLRFGALPVTALESDQEVEGICYLPGVQDGIFWQIHAVLLDQNPIDKDEVFFKHYARIQP